MNGPITGPSDRLYGNLMVDSTVMVTSAIPLSCDVRTVVAL
jgi:hypothetical protein